MINRKAISNKAVRIVILSILLAIAGVGGFFAFRALTAPSIIGTWELVESTTFSEFEDWIETFYPDGTGTWNGADIGEPEDFTWVTYENRLTITNEWGAHTSHFRVAGSDLFIYNTDESDYDWQLIFRRVD